MRDVHEGEGRALNPLAAAQRHAESLSGVQQTLEECAVEGDMEGKAKLNLDVTGDVTAKIVCKTDNDTEKK